MPDINDVGRSCILVSIGGKNIMLDCGMHMGYNDDRRFPDFSYITQNGRLTEFLDCVIIRLPSASSCWRTSERSQ
uniref:Integrator complex subunit 11 n=1 Tax=Sinocyclocheilus rhinocerous TaxID=307959 RepID=A0A673HF91_9TELE